MMCGKKEIKTTPLLQVSKKMEMAKIMFGARSKRYLSEADETK